ncbi:MAG: hypothetical protein JG777_1106 [Clostridia bacterium]|jgi:hypothetical protein|uniref:hypothetical protein n=1 Tax=Petroclostridium xylanilyticum TaxID=1792311 RepID=UPI000B98E353|nr:hypothetical protein [Petroclostridium xylanilyticum]MBZ4645617.1 hypothetical protein [Clostridia bacterium]
MKSSKDSEVIENKFYNFLVNLSNQANLAGTNNISPVQLNSVLVFISPYALENLNFEGLDIDLRVDEKGSIWINDHPFQAIEIKPGVKVLGISRR